MLVLIELLLLILYLRPRRMTILLCNYKIRISKRSFTKIATTDISIYRLSTLDKFALARFIAIKHLSAVPV